MLLLPWISHLAGCVGDARYSEPRQSCAEPTCEHQADCEACVAACPADCFFYDLPEDTDGAPAPARPADLGLVAVVLLPRLRDVVELGLLQPRLGVDLGVLRPTLTGPGAGGGSEGRSRGPVGAITSRTKADDSYPPPSPE